MGNYVKVLFLNGETKRILKSFLTIIPENLINKVIKYKI